MSFQIIVNYFIIVLLYRNKLFLILILIQTRLPFGISSATGYFQDVMNYLTGDLPGVAVYLDDIRISGKTAEDHLNNLRRLLKRLNDRGLRCLIQKCVFAQDSMTYLGHTISRDGISKGPKADAVTKMPASSNVSQLRSFLGSVQFYNKFLLDLSTISEPLYHYDGEAHKIEMGGTTTRCIPETEADAYKQHRPGPL